MGMPFTWAVSTAYTPSMSYVLPLFELELLRLVKLRLVQEAHCPSAVAVHAERYEPAGHCDVEHAEHDRPLR